MLSSTKKAKAFEVRPRDVLDLARLGDIDYFRTFFAACRAAADGSAPSAAPSGDAEEGDAAASETVPDSGRPMTSKSAMSVSNATADDVTSFTDKFGCTALHAAACHGHYRIAAILLDEGADVNAQTDSGLTALHCAAEYGHHAVFVLLLKHDARVDLYTDRHELALTLAVRGRHSAIQVDLEPRVRALTTSEDALVAAAAGDMLYFTLLLIDLSNPAKRAEALKAASALSDTDDNVLHVACKVAVITPKIVEVIKLVIDKKLASPDSTNASRLTPLMYATRAKNIALMTFLLDAGADPTITADLEDASRTALAFTSDERLKVLLDEREKKWDFDELYKTRNEVKFAERAAFVVEVSALHRRWLESKENRDVYYADNGLEPEA